MFDLARLDAGETLMQIAPHDDRARESRATRQPNEQGPGADHGAAIPAPGGAGELLIAPFPIDDIPERPALEIGAQIVAEEIDGAMTVLITGRRDMRRDQYPGIGPEP